MFARLHTLETTPGQYVLEKALTGIAVTAGRWLYAIDMQRRRLIRFRPPLAAA